VSRVDAVSVAGNEVHLGSVVGGDVERSRDDVAEVGGLAGLPPSKGLPNSDHRNRLTVTASRCAALATSLSGECVSSCLPSSLARGWPSIAPSPHAIH
jgi:hypothetical protein